MITSIMITSMVITMTWCRDMQMTIVDRVAWALAWALAADSHVDCPQRRLVPDAAHAHKVERREDAVHHTLVLPPVRLVLQTGTTAWASNNGTGKGA